MELKRIEATLIGYNQAADDLYNIRIFWDSLSDETRGKPDNIKKMVEATERSIQSENNSWLHDMQDKLKELYGIDSKDGKDSESSPVKHDSQTQDSKEEPHN